MSIEQDFTYFSERERAERGLAANAKTRKAAEAHLSLAASYRKRADDVRRQLKVEEHIVAAERSAPAIQSERQAAF